MLKTRPNKQKDVMALNRERTSDYQDRITSYIDKKKVSPEHRLKLFGLMGDRPIDGRIPFSDFKACDEASEIMSQLLRTERKNASDTRRYFSVTLTFDVGNTSDRTPQLNVSALRGKIDRALRRIKLDGVAAIEMQGLMNYPAKGKGRAIMTHGHACAWTDDPNFDAATAQRELNASRACTNALGTLPIVVRPITSKGHFRRLASYLIKQPHDVSNSMPCDATPGTYTLMSTRKGYRPEFALRIFEGRSQLELTDGVFGVGTGAPVVRAWRTALRNWDRARKRSPKTMPNFDVARFWREFRSQHGSKKFEPYQIVSDSTRPPLFPQRHRIEVIRGPQEDGIAALKALRNNPGLAAL